MQVYQKKKFLLTVIQTDLLFVHNLLSFLSLFFFFYIIFVLLQKHHAGPG